MDIKEKVRDEVKAVTAVANEIKWCIHITGVDEAFAMPDYSSARITAFSLNKGSMDARTRLIVEGLLGRSGFAVAVPFELAGGKDADHAAALDNDVAKLWASEIQRPEFDALLFI